MRRDASAKLSYAAATRRPRRFRDPQAARLLKPGHGRLPLQLYSMATPNGVKVTIMFRGREMAHPETAARQLDLLSRDRVAPARSLGPEALQDYTDGYLSRLRQSDGDMAALAPAYQVESLRAYDSLPQTPHVELIAKLVRT